MDTILKKLRASKDSPNQNTSNMVSYFILIGLLAFGYYVFFFNPSKILNYVRAPMMIIYIVLLVFTLYFIFNRLKEAYPIFNTGLELTTHTFTMGKLFLFIFITFITFYIFYKFFVAIVVKSLSISFILTVILLFIILALVDSYTHISDSESPNMILEMIKDLIFYIPCLITDFIEYIKKDYKNTPTTTIILFYFLITFFIMYIIINMTRRDSPLLLIKEPSYLNSAILNIDQPQLMKKIIQSRPWYEQFLLNLQDYNESILFDFSQFRTDISHNTLSYDSATDTYSENFTSVMTQELFPVHLNISEYDRYILKQAIYRDNSIAAQINDASNNPAIINAIIIQQQNLMNLYQRMIVAITYASSKNISKMIVGDINASRYHYSISFWLYLYANQSLTGKDKIITYGSRPSMYYDNATKELTVETKDSNNVSVVLYNTSHILYQRWNHVVMNYNYGTFDLFVNNYLVFTKPGIVSELSKDDLLQVGFISNNDLGGITKLLYSDEPLQIKQIQKLYLDKPKF